MRWRVEIRAILLMVMLLCLGVASGASEAVSESPLYVGWSTVDITPARPVALVGQLHKRISQRVRDPLTATALAIESRPESGPREQAILVSCDVLFIRKAMQDRGFGVITEIDVKKILKEKIDLDFRPYRILGTCNPTVAAEALTHNPEIGLLLPCNIVLWENDDQSVTVAAVDARQLLSIAGNDALADKADEVNCLLQAAIDSL